MSKHHHRGKNGKASHTKKKTLISTIRSIYNEVKKSSAVHIAKSGRVNTAMMSHPHVNQLANAVNKQAAEMARPKKIMSVRIVK